MGVVFPLQAPISRVPQTQGLQQQHHQQQDGGGGSGSDQATGLLQAAEQAGTVSGVQNLQTKGGAEETVGPASATGQFHGSLSQEVQSCPCSERRLSSCVMHNPAGVWFVSATSSVAKGC